MSVVQMQLDPLLVLVLRTIIDSVGIVDQKANDHVGVECGKASLPIVNDVERNSNSKGRRGGKDQVVEVEALRSL
ncbi:hypothetical protein V6N11_084049 [Hibiscus sabdariffa]|uniref:Uncharacterized protein n=1 Tax=Hibiscus sabdariffa TaxID=183260 RepID=A0ABR2QDB5_9ROSI